MPIFYQNVPYLRHFCFLLFKVWGRKSICHHINIKLCMVIILWLIDFWPPFFYLFDIKKGVVYIYLNSNVYIQIHILRTYSYLDIQTLKWENIHTTHFHFTFMWFANIHSPHKLNQINSSLRLILIHIMAKFHTINFCQIGYCDHHSELIDCHMHTKNKRMKKFHKKNNKWQAFLLTFMITVRIKRNWLAYQLLQEPKKKLYRQINAHTLIFYSLIFFLLAASRVSFY